MSEKYYVIWFDRRENSMTAPVSEFDTQSEAVAEVSKQRADNLPAYAISAAEYKEFTKRDAARDFQASQA